MSEYSRVMSFIFRLAGNEFVTQLLLISLMFVPIKKRKLFFVRYPLCWAVIIGLQWLHNFVLPIPQNLGFLLYVEVTLMLYATVLISFECRPAQALFLTMCIYDVQFMVSELSYAFILFIVHCTAKWENFLYYFITMPITMAGAMAATYFLPVRKLRSVENVKFNSYALLYASAVFVAAAIFLSYYLAQEIFISTLGQVLIRLSFMLLGSFSIILCFSNLRVNNLQMENAFLQQLLYRDEQRYRQAKIENEKMQIKYHDFKKWEEQGIINYAMMEEEDLDKELINSLYFTGNRALDVILSEKALMCSRMDIRLVCTADGDALKFMKSYHVYSLLGNALDNAIESLNGVQQDELKEIDLSVSQHGGMLLINISNYVKDENIVMYDGLPQTTKEDNMEHGYGTKSMKMVVDLYGGKINLNVNNNLFTVVVVIPVKEYKFKR